MATAGTTPTIESANLFDQPGISFTKHSNLDVLQSQARGHVLPKSNVHAEFLSVAALPNARPERVLLGTIADPDLRVVRAIPLDVSVEDCAVLVSWTEIDEFGSGATMSEAIEDFSHSLREIYHRLNESGVRLGPDLISIKATIGQYVQRRHHESA